MAPPHTHTPGFTLLARSEETGQTFSFPAGGSFSALAQSQAMAAAEALGLPPPPKLLPADAELLLKRAATGCEFKVHSCACPQAAIQRRLPSTHTCHATCAVQGGPAALQPPCTAHVEGHVYDNRLCMDALAWC